jgi:thiol-disulfide isomerase/thioredoxin
MSMVFLIHLTAQTISQTKSSVVISGQFNDIDSGDSLALFVWDYFPQLDYDGTPVFTTVRSGSFSFYLKGVSKPKYISLAKYKNKIVKNPMILPLTLIKPGDSILMRSFNNRLLFSGRGFQKAKCAYDMARKSRWYIMHFPLQSETLTEKSLPGLLQYNEQINTSVYQVLKSYKNKINSADYQIMQADYIGSTGITIFQQLLMFNFAGKTSAQQKVIKNIYSGAMQRMQHDYPLEAGSPANLVYSRYYPEFIIESIRVDSFFLQNRPFDFRKVYMLLKKKYSGAFRECLMVTLFRRHHREAGDINYCLEDALTYCKNKDFKEIIKRFQVMHAGADVPNFTWKNSLDNWVSLSDLAGKIVVLDFWYTGCGNCRRLFKELSTVETDFKADTTIVFISVSIDADKTVWLNSVQSNQYTNKDNINLYTSGKGITDSFIQKYNINSFPTLLIIDRKGKMISSNPPDPRLDHGMALKDLIARIK